MLGLILLLLLAVGPAALAQPEESGGPGWRNAVPGEEWSEVEGPPTSGSFKASRALEAPTVVEWPEPALQGPFWKIWGQLQFEASYQKDKDAAGATSHSDQAVLATAEVFLELTPLPFTRGLLHFLHQDGNSGVDLDEGFVVLGRTPKFPGYLMGGRLYPAVGLFESFMISDGITKELFETQASGLEAGWSSQWYSFSLTGINAPVREPGDSGGLLANYLVRADLVLPKEALGGLEMRVGGSYTNNIAASDFLQEQVPNQRLSSLVAGWSLSASAQYKHFSLLAEYMRAGTFEPGELQYAPPDSRPQPWAFSLELAWVFAEDWVLSGRWEGGGDLYSEFPQRQYGLSVSWQPMKYLALALEYQRGYFSDGAESDLVTTQLSLMF
ncbi:MAG: LbtU family siderophore porin [Desulfarculaceae bacterium]|nr:LbtU family siderophore porin [Desulfarculaceae bacterium]MCF8103274.1 LbtU family siderophore porin [Desulfarculaceae bacterium]MCF8116868.1 LbtU family siderophore porin [Desulfarculaceae bacterium]